MNWPSAWRIGRIYAQGVHLRSDRGLTCLLYCQTMTTFGNQKGSPDFISPLKSEIRNPMFLFCSVWSLLTYLNKEMVVSVDYFHFS